MHIKWKIIGLAAGAVTFGAEQNMSAAIVERIGSGYSWPTSWTEIPGINDPNDSLTTAHLDFFGDATYYGGYYAADANYVNFRVRVNQNIMPTPNSALTGTILVLIDNSGDSRPDYSFSWDMQSNNDLKHGLELEIPNSVGVSWSNTTMKDNDGNSGSKLAGDFNFASSTDGYIRTVDQQPGNTSFIDIAASWTFLAKPKTENGGQTTLAPGQTWKVQFASVNNANDHSALDYDVAANSSPSSFTWAADISTVPEPEATGWIASLLCAGTAVFLRCKRKTCSAQ